MRVNAMEHGVLHSSFLVPSSVLSDFGSIDERGIGPSIVRALGTPTLAKSIDR